MIAIFILVLSRTDYWFPELLSKRPNFSLQPRWQHQFWKQWFRFKRRRWQEKEKLWGIQVKRVPLWKDAVDKINIMPPIIINISLSPNWQTISAVAEAAQKFRSACQVLFRHSWWQETGWSTLPRLQLMRTGSRSKDRILLQHSVVYAFVNASATKLWRQVPKTFEHRRQHSCTWARFRLCWSW